VVGYVVMPEHFHLLISEPERGNAGGDASSQAALRLWRTGTGLGE
jgi:hypothetical protein